MKVVTQVVKWDEKKCTGAKMGLEENARGNMPFCQAACPMHIDVRGYIRLIRERKYDDAAQLIRRYVPFPRILERICPHTCELSCKRGEIDEPIAINSLKRSANEYAKISIDTVVPPPPKEQVAIIGAGPAGLTAAYYLAKEGYLVTIFEKLDILGGMMAVGIPKFRLPRDLLSAETKVIQDMGVEITTGVTFGENITLADLKRQGYEAAFLATGLHYSLRLNIEGENLPGVLKGLEFLKAAIFENQINIGKRVIVIGGGNVAIDVALTAKRLGAKDISIVCLEKRDEMPAWDNEIAQALEEGIGIVNSLGPKRFLETDGKLSGIEFQRCTSVLDKKGVFSPRYDETDVTMMDADTAIVTIGQGSDLSVNNEDGTLFSSTGRLEADPFTLQSKIEWVFLGGDALYGPKTVVEAMASGKRAAESIKRYIQGEDLSADREWDGPSETDLQVNTEGVSPSKRCSVHTLPVNQREGNCREVNLVFTKQEAEEEAERCLSCECRMCETVCPTRAIEIVDRRTVINEDKCVACFKCVDACQQNAFTIVSRSEPIILGLDPSEVDQAQLKELCMKAHLHPRQIICLCTETLVSEVAAAVLKGAKTPEEIALMTGAWTGCGVYCIAPILRLLKAHGVEIVQPKDDRWYNSTASIWDVSPELAKKYPGYYLEEDKKVFRKVE